ncbi:MAG TPA: nucleotidyltransferase domain-containing protein, partial [Candidatus Lokiarchaeia archaeon]|nr:nucleotidyltransferase domain-containing protein [Candidatus Lokiarchaeia archaeon]
MAETTIITQVSIQLANAKIQPYFSDLIVQYLEVLENHNIPVRAILLYGSVARRRAQKTISDVDL